VPPGKRRGGDPSKRKGLDDGKEGRESFCRGRDERKGSFHLNARKKKATRKTEIVQEGKKKFPSTKGFPKGNGEKETSSLEINRQEARPTGKKRGEERRALQRKKKGEKKC